jgi:hypothetical protein
MRKSRARPPKGWHPAMGMPIDKGNNPTSKGDPVIVEHLTRWHDRLEAEGKLSEVTVERLEWGLAFLAYIMERDGPAVAPLYERLERELVAMRQTDDTAARAKRLLESYGGRRPLAAIAPPVLAIAPPIDGDHAVFTAPRRAPNQA